MPATARRPRVGSLSPEYRRYYYKLTRDRYHARLYGLTLEQYKGLLAKQNGVCAICGGDNNGKSFHVDHSHETGDIRGMLCTACNCGLGLFSESCTVLSKAIAYLGAPPAIRSNRATLVPDEMLLELIGDVT